MIGGLACLRQRHLKRILAFSTVSHGGILLIGLALPGPTAASPAMRLKGMQRAAKCLRTMLELAFPTAAMSA
ncbi:MAG: proton-conducting transporter membrane subunit [Steroidobacteraceae bacterium]